MSEMVERYVKDGEEIVVDTVRHGIEKNKMRELKNKEMHKRFRVVNRKRVIRDDFICLPFGYTCTSLHE